MQDGLYLLAFGIFGNMTQETGRSIKYRKAAKAAPEGEFRFMRLLSDADGHLIRHP